MKGKKRALIIYGQLDSREAKTLEECGYEVEHADDLEKAAIRLASGKYDALVAAEGDLEALGHHLVSKESPSASEPSPVDIDWQMALAEIVANSTDANLAYLDPNFNFVWVNIAYAERFGRSKSELIGRSYFDFSTTADDIAVFEQVRDTGLVYTAVEKPYENPVRPGVEVSYWNWTLVPIRHRYDPVGTTRGFALTMVDVTHDVRARKEIERLREHAEKQAREMSAVFEALTDAVIVYDTKGVITYVNPAAIRVFGMNPVSLTKAKLQHMLIVQALDGKQLETQDMPSVRALRGETVVDEQFNLTNAEGRKLTVMASASPLKAGDEIVGAVAIWHDITELEKAHQREQELEHQNREFFRKTIIAATEGKLIITEPEEISRIAGKPLKSWVINGPGDLALIRDEATEIALELGLERDRIYGLLSSLGEATSNVIKYAGKGAASIHQVDGGVIIVVSDKGRGIGAMNLPNVALVRGYSTSGTAGLGYKIIIRCSDRVYLATGKEGTLLAFEIKKH